MSGTLTQHARKVLIVGGGIGGSAAAIRFAERGAAVALIDIETDWGAAGTGVTLSTATCRALCDLGFAEALMAQGHMHDSLQMFAPTGQMVNEIPGHRLYSPDVPSEGGVMRPVLHKMMEERMRALGVTIRTGLSVSALDQDDAGVDVTFTDGSTGRHDLVIGADGLFSAMRAMLFPDAPQPQYTGQVCWRAQMPLPQDWTTGRMYFGPIKVGFTPCAPNEMYMFLLETVAEKPRYDDAELLGKLKALLAPFPALAGLRDAMDADTPILARPLEAVLLDDPWYRGRVVLIGDAAHATTPHLASGAGMAVEDAIVLVEELDRESDYDTALRAFMARRLPRGRMVVENSLKLGEMEINHAPPEDMGALMMQSLKALAAPY